MRPPHGAGILLACALGVCCWLAMVLLWCALARAADTACETPPYYGFGASTPGGKGQPVFAVTTLADGGAGSLREALSAGNRCIIFRVSGEIRLQSPINVRHPWLTVDGFAAPGHVIIGGYGLQLAGKSDPYTSTSDAHDIILRGLTFAPTDNTQGQDVDSIGIYYGAYNIVVTQNTFHGPTADPQGTTDEQVDVSGGAHDVTIAWNLMFRRFGGGSTQLLLVSGKATRVSIHHNLLSDATDKMPTIVGDIHSDYVDSGTTVDFVNNYIVNKRGGEGAAMGDGARVNIDRNYFRYLPAEMPPPERYRLLITCNRARLEQLGNPPDAVAWCTAMGAATNKRHDGYFYAKGNVTPDAIPPGYPKSLDAWGTQSTPFPAPALPATDALQAACAILREAGRRPLQAPEQQLLARVPVPKECSDTLTVESPTEFRVRKP